MPVALATLVLTLLTSATVTGAERAAPAMGQGVAIITETFDRALVQTPDGSTTLTSPAPATTIPGWKAGAPAAQRAAALGELTGGTVVPSAWVPARIRTGARELPVGISVTSLPPQVTGRLTLVDGRWPTGPGEIAVQPGTTDWTGSGMRLVADDGSDGTPIAVVGTVRAEPGVLSSTEVLSGDWSLATGADTQFTVLRDTPMGWAEVQRLNAHGLAVLSRAVLADPPPPADIAPELRGSAITADTHDLRYLPLGAIATGVGVLLLAGLAHLVWRTKARGRAMPLAYAAPLSVLGSSLGVLAGAGAAWLAVRLLRGRVAELAGPFDLRWSVAGWLLLAGLLGGLLAALWPRVVESGRWVVALLVLAIVGGSAGYALLSSRVEASAGAARAAYVPAGKVGEATVTWDPEKLSLKDVEKVTESAAPGLWQTTRMVPNGELFARGSGADQQQPVVSVVPPGCSPERALHDPTPVTADRPESPCQKVGSTGTLASGSILVLPAETIAARFGLDTSAVEALRSAALVLVPGLTNEDTLTVMQGTARLSGRTGELTLSDVRTWKAPAITLQPSREREVLSLRSGVVLSSELAAAHELPTRPDAILVSPDSSTDWTGTVLPALRAAMDALAVGDGSILVQDEPGFVRSDRLLRLGLPLATLLGVIVLGLAATAVWLARRDRQETGASGSRRWSTVLWATLTTLVATGVGLTAGAAAALATGARPMPFALWAVVLCGAALGTAVITAVSVRSRPPRTA